MQTIEWRSPNSRHYITGCYTDGINYHHGFHSHGMISRSDSWSSFPGRTIINRDLRRHKKYQKARRLYGSLYVNQFGIQIAYKVKRTI
jgi:hypothetical protein